jgi:hypothetical protein
MQLTWWFSSGEISLYLIANVAFLNVKKMFTTSIYLIHIIQPWVFQIMRRGGDIEYDEIHLIECPHINEITCLNKKVNRLSDVEGMHLIVIWIINIALSHLIYKIKQFFRVDLQKLANRIFVLGEVDHQPSKLLTFI